ncbi:MAG: hypothetical protein ACI4EX_14230 [Lachnospiraceae bacterium]
MKKMKQCIIGLIIVFGAISLCACCVKVDEKDLITSETEKTETQIPDEMENVLPAEVEEPEKESTVDDTEEATLESDYSGEAVVEIVNLRGDKTTVYKLADGTYLDRIERHFTYNGTDTWTDEDGVEWNEVVK